MRAERARRGRRPGRGLRGALLLEVMLALVIFIGAGLAILAAIGQAGDSLTSARQRQQAIDIARSAMAKLEAGIESAETLSGPVPEWRDEEAEGGAGFEDDLPPPSGWELSVQTSPFGAGGLTLVEITASRRTERTRAVLASATLRQLVRLSPEAADRVGAEDEVSREAARGAAEEERRERSRIRDRSSGSRDGGSR